MLNMKGETQIIVFFKLGEVKEKINVNTMEK